MKTFPLFLTTLLLLNGSFIIADVSQPTSINQTTNETQPSPLKNTLPPFDIHSPVFPPEELVQEPTQETNKFITEFINMLATLGLIIALILIVAWFLKRMVNSRVEQMNSTSAIKVTERRNLSPKSILYLVEVENKMILISESQNGITRLTEFNSTTQPLEPVQNL